MAEEIFHSDDQNLAADIGADVGPIIGNQKKVGGGPLEAGSGWGFGWLRFLFGRAEAGQVEPLLAAGGIIILMARWDSVVRSVQVHRS